MRLDVNLCMGIFLVFLGLKLSGIINWSWWLVTMPLWIIPIAILFAFAFCFIIKVFLK